MIDIKKKENCCGCHACAQICPKHCITMQEDKEGFLYPKINEKTCINCGACEKVCPIMRNAPEPKNKTPDAYAAINQDESVRLQSSSGGVFSLLAQWTIENGGVVFGAAMSEDCRSVRHIKAENVQELKELRGSKYLQSIIGNTYCQVKKELESGRKVLFTGTPCQIEGLKSFLQRSYENLLCVDLICHGVPSPLVWRTYLSEQENRAGAPTRRTFFRHKKYGWKTYALLLEFSNNKTYESILSKDAFMQAFLQDACLRPSCHSCRFKKLNRVSDITIADYWGIQNQIPQMDDDKGTSLVLLHSAKGKEIFRSICENLSYQKVDVKTAISGNPSMLTSVKPHRHRDEFFDHLGKVPFDVLVKRYASPSRSYYRKLKSGIRKIYTFLQDRV